MPSSSTSLILADIGGTNARFAIADAPGGPIRAFKSFKTERFAAFEDALAAYLSTLGADAPKLLAAGAAGPLIGGAIHLTNLNWTIDPKVLKQRFQIETRMLVNDLAAMAAGIALAPSEAFLFLPGPQIRAPRRVVVIAIGTGLGVSWYERTESKPTVHATESGHMRYAPSNAEEARFAARLLEARGTLSFENLVSGSGIRLVHASLRQEGDPEFAKSEEIFLAAESGANASAVSALDLVTRALCTFARGLLFVLGGADEIVFAGGIGRRLRARLGSDAFLGRLRDPTASPLDFSGLGARIAMDDSLPLTGAANLAYGLAQTAT